MVIEREKFSVCMCLYAGDDPGWFRQAAESILVQTLPPDDIVLVVDGPIGASLEDEVHRLELVDTVQVIRMKENRGLGQARAEGLSHCRYDLVAMMDSDDISVSDRFERQIQIFSDTPECAIVGGQISEFLGEPEHKVGIRKVCCTDADIRRDLKKRCPMNHVSVMLRKSAIEKVGGYRDWFYNEDYYLWVRMYLAGMKFANDSHVLVNVRVGADMYRRRGGWRYFLSELKLQNFMLVNRVIGPGIYVVNVVKRAIVQLILPNGLRSWAFQRFARTKEEA